MNSKTVIVLIGIIVVCVIATAAFLQFSKSNEASKIATQSTQDALDELIAPVLEVPQETASQQEQPTIQESEQQNPSQEQQTFNPMKQYTATLTTDKGDIVIAFNRGATPKTVENFVTLAQKKFYDGTIFHRTIKGFMIQGGDPKGDGTGGPGYKFDDEPFTGEYTRGTIAMANSGPNTNGSQFFIMHQDYPLPNNYVIFGHVTKGLDVVDAIATAPVMSGGEQSKPVTPVKMLSVSISE